MIADMVAAALAACRKKGKVALRPAGVFICLFLLVSMPGCSPKLYNVNMRYEPTKVIQPVQSDGRKYSLTVASFTDRRKMEDTIMIGRVIQSNGTSIPILPKYVKPTDAVASALRELMFKAGYTVSPATANFLGNKRPAIRQVIPVSGSSTGSPRKAALPWIISSFPKRSWRARSTAPSRTPWKRRLGGGRRTARSARRSNNSCLFHHLIGEDGKEKAWRV
jgi:hypothetical protein